MNPPERQPENPHGILAEALAARTPHTFTIQYPPSRGYFQRAFAGTLPANILSRHKRLLLYVHIPFCEQRCFYCNFAVDLRKSRDTHERYAAALSKQLSRLDALVPEDVSVPGIDIGGGTPTRLEADTLELVLRALEPWRGRLEHQNNAHISIETTPSIAAKHPERLAVLRAGGVERISMGVQSTNDETLAMVNRRRQREMTEKALENLHAAGFKRINVDLVFGLPGQTTEHLLEDLERVVAMGVDSVTTYDCLYRGKGRILPGLQSDWPSPVTYAKMYDAAYNLMERAGFSASYGGVNFSRHAHESGTSSYFEKRLLDGMPYLGAGNYASSAIDASWFFAPYEVDDYVAAIESGESLPVQDVYTLPLEERAAKHMLASLNYGIIDPVRFEQSLGTSFMGMFGDRIAYARERGWIVASETEGEHPRWHITPGRFDHLYALRALFYSPRALSWVQQNLDAIWESHLESATVER
jgi:oxygen-independent coproporphyrinogen-3 oxidase